MSTNLRIYYLKQILFLLKRPGEKEGMNLVLNN